MSFGCSQSGKGHGNINQEQTLSTVQVEEACSAASKKANVFPDSHSSSSVEFVKGFGHVAVVEKREGSKKQEPVLGVPIIRPTIFWGV